MKDYQFFIITILLFVVSIYIHFQTLKVLKHFKGEQPENNSNIIMMVLLILISIIFFPWLFTSSIFENFSNTGAIGDTIGGITAPFINGLGAVLVYIAFKEQVKANQLVQDQFKKQEKGDIRKNFESTFFQLLQIHHDIVAKMDFRLKILMNDTELGKKIQEIVLTFVTEREMSAESVKDSITGRDVFKESFIVMQSLINHYVINENGDEDDKKAKEILDTIYAYVYHKMDADYGHYFRNLYRIIKIIDEQDFHSQSEEEEFKIKYSYSSIVRSQLSDYEIYWMYYNGMYDYGEKFKPLIEDYALLKILRYNEDPTIFKFKSNYKFSAYGLPKNN